MRSRSCRVRSLDLKDDGWAWEMDCWGQEWKQGDQLRGDDNTLGGGCVRGSRSAGDGEDG